MQERLLLNDLVKINSLYHLLFWYNERTHYVNSNWFRGISIAEPTSKKCFGTLHFRKVSKQNYNSHFILQIFYSTITKAEVVDETRICDRNLSVGCGRTGSSSSTSLIAVT